MRGGKKRRMTDGGRVCACLSARELIRAGVCVHLTELLLLDELVDLGIGILEGLEGLGEDGFLSREGSGTSSVPMSLWGAGAAACVPDRSTGGHADVSQIGPRRRPRSRVRAGSWRREIAGMGHAPSLP